MKIKVNITKKYTFLFLGIMLLLAGAVFVIAQNPGHTGNQINVETRGDVKTLQEAIDAGDFVGEAADKNEIILMSGVPYDGEVITGGSGDTADREVIQNIVGQYSFCALDHVEINDGDSPNEGGGGGCQVYQESSTWKIKAYRSDITTRVVCGAVCIERQINP